MFSVLWTWLRARTRDAVLAGVSDAVAALDGSGEDGTADAAAALLGRLRALPLETEETGGKKRK